MAQINPQFQSIGEQFAKHYYGSFNNRESLRSLYCAESMLTFEGEAFQGVDKIMGKLNGLAFKSCLRKIKILIYKIEPNCQIES